MKKTSDLSDTENVEDLVSHPSKHWRMAKNPPFVVNIMGWPNPAGYVMGWAGVWVRVGPDQPQPNPHPGSGLAQVWRVIIVWYYLIVTVQA